MNIPTFELNGKVALVTGGSKGIGYGMAMALGKYGATIAINGRKVADGDRAVDEFKSQGITAKFYPADVSNKTEVEGMIEDIVSDFGKIDILVNNAGMNIRKPLLEIEEQDWDTVLAINLKGIFLTGQAVARQMVKQGSGKIINISSILGGIGLPTQTSYAASKGGINQLTKVWASELAEHGILVNGIGPAYIQTPMTEKYLSDPERLKKITDRTPLRRVGKMEDLAGPVLFLASDASNYVTGHTLYVDGGWLAV